MGLGDKEIKTQIINITEQSVLTAETAYTPREIWQRYYPPHEQQLVLNAVRNEHLIPAHREIFWQNWQIFLREVEHQFRTSVSASHVNLVNVIESAMLSVRRTYDTAVPLSHAEWLSAVDQKRAAGKFDLDVHMRQVEQFAERLADEAHSYLVPLMRVHDVIKFALPFELDGEIAKGQHEVDHEMLLKALFDHLAKLISATSDHVTFQWGQQSLNQNQAVTAMQVAGHLGCNHENLSEEQAWYERSKSNELMPVMFTLDTFTDALELKEVDGRKLLLLNDSHLGRFIDLVNRHLFTGLDKDPAKTYQPEWPLYALAAILSGAETIAQWHNAAWDKSSERQIIVAMLAQVENRQKSLIGTDNTKAQTAADLKMLHDKLQQMRDKTDQTELSEDAEVGITAFRHTLERALGASPVKWLAQQFGLELDNRPVSLDTEEAQYWRVIQNLPGAMSVLHHLANVKDVSIAAELKRIVHNQVPPYQMLQLSRAAHAGWLLSRLGIKPPATPNLPTWSEEKFVSMSEDWIQVQAAAQALLGLMGDQEMNLQQLADMILQPASQQTIAAAAQASYIDSIIGQSKQPKSPVNPAQRLQGIAEYADGQWQGQPINRPAAANSAFQKRADELAPRRDFLLKIPSVIALLEELPVLARELNIPPLGVLQQVIGDTLSPDFMTRLVTMQKMLHLYAHIAIGDGKYRVNSLINHDDDSYQKDKKDLMVMAKMLQQALNVLPTDTDDRLREIAQIMGIVPEVVRPEADMQTELDKKGLLSTDVVIFVSGGAALMETTDLRQFEDDLQQTIVDALIQGKTVTLLNGGTNSGIMQNLGNVASRIFKNPDLDDHLKAKLHFVGVAPSATIAPYNSDDHSFFEVVPSLTHLFAVQKYDHGGRPLPVAFGDETQVMEKMLHAWRQHNADATMVAITANGGVGTVRETIAVRAVDQMVNFFLAGSGRWATLVEAVNNIDLNSISARTVDAVKAAIKAQIINLLPENDQENVRQRTIEQIANILVALTAEPDASTGSQVRKDQNGQIDATGFNNWELAIKYIQKLQMPVLTAPAMMAEVRSLVSGSKEER